jgi:NAD(P)-dependent dehydrogenase (short-subunit alcohol dehydrogenase family)
MDERQERPPTADGILSLTGTPSLSGRRALIVGGSGGLGAAFAEALALRGADLVIHGGSSVSGLEASILRAQGARAQRAREKAASCGESQDASIEGFLLALDRPADLISRLPRLGRIDILVCAFGPFFRAPLHETSAEDWERLALLDLALPGALASALLPEMVRQDWGRMLFFGGTRTDSIRAYASNAAYAAAKTGLGVLVKSLAAEYAAWGLGAFLLCPGFVETEYLSPDAKAELALRAPKGRLLKAEALAEFGAGLIASEPALASGAIINLDGGLKL